MHKSFFREKRIDIYSVAILKCMCIWKGFSPPFLSALEQGGGAAVHISREQIKNGLWERDAAVIISRYFSRLVRLSRLTREKRTQTSVGDWFPWLHKRYDVMWGVAPQE